MSFALYVMVVLLGCSLGRTFVIRPSEKEPDLASGSHTSRTKSECQRESLQSIRKALLAALNLQKEPQLAADGLSGIRAQWKTTFTAISHTAQTQAVPVTHPEGPGVYNSTGQKCCQLASQIFLKDLGWENWVIYPESFTYVQCAPCNPQLDLSTLHCPSHTPNVQHTASEMQCCQLISQELVPFLYMDELSTLVISSVQLTRTCGCGPGNHPMPTDD